MMALVGVVASLCPAHPPSNAVKAKLTIIFVAFMMCVENEVGIL